MNEIQEIAFEYGRAVACSDVHFARGEYEESERYKLLAKEAYDRLLELGAVVDDDWSLLDEQADKYCDAAMDMFDRRAYDPDYKLLSVLTMIKQDNWDTQTLNTIESAMHKTRYMMFLKQCGFFAKIPSLEELREWRISYIKATITALYLELQLYQSLQAQEENNE